MRNRIPAETTMKILTELGLGYTNKEVAQHFNVSQAYVSKVKTGKKVPYIYIQRNDDQLSDDLKSIQDRDVVLNFLQKKLQAIQHEVQIYSTIINALKEDNN